MNRLLLRLTLLACMLIAMMQTEAQGWMKKYSPDMMMAINAVYPTADGGYLTTGWNVGGLSYRQRIQQVDGLGNVLWHREVDSIYSVTSSVISQQRGLIILGVGVPQPGNSSPAVIVKTDANGQKLWQHQLHPEWTMFAGVGNTDIDTTDDGGFVCAYTALDTTGGNTHRHVYVSRFDSLGVKLWDQLYFPADTGGVVYTLRNNTGGGGFMFTADHSINHGSVLVKIDESGAQQWVYTPTGVHILCPTVAIDGNIMVVESQLATSGTNYLSGLDPAGNVLWTHTYTLPDSMTWYGQLVMRSDYTFALMGGKFGSQDKFSVSHADTAGHILEYRRVFTSNLGNQSSLYSTQNKCIARAHDGGIIFGGWMQNDPDGYSGFLIKTDSTGQVYPSAVSGLVFADGNSNCTQDSAEIAVPRAYVTYADAQDTFMLLTHNGFYSLGLDTGVYSIHVTPPSPYWQPSACNPATAHLPAGTDTTISLGVTPIVSAPYIMINGHLGRQVLCRPVTYTAQYCNTGTAPFTGIVQFTVDTLLTVDSASIPWISHTGNIYNYLLSPLGVLECGTIELYCTVRCDVADLGRTNCINAQAFQDTIVNANPLWDGSNLRMSVSYDHATDTVTFLVQNLGTGSMSGPQGLTVIEDNVILITTPVQIPAGAQITKGFHANGATLRATLPQSPYNPYSTFTTAAIEGVGVDSTGNISLGYITQYPYNGYSSYSYLECGEIRGAYDPNEKEVSPKGAGADHLIDTNVVLEYTIDFQNTGTDTAYAVTVVDTLAPYLDPATLRLVGSSPDAQVAIAGNAVTFTMPHAFLPDSNVNLLGSMGFVKFSIRQRAGNAMGTVINNKAGIIFDYNPPVTTNTATVRIGKVLLTAVQTLYSKPLDIAAYPNPFTTMTTIRVGGDAFRVLTLCIYDLTGRQVRRQEAHHMDHLLLDREGLSSGTYLFEVWGDGQKIGTGKMIAD